MCPRDVLPNWACTSANTSRGGVGQIGNSISGADVASVHTLLREQEETQCSGQGSLSMARLPQLGTIGFDRHHPCLCLHRSRALRSAHHKRFMQSAPKTISQTLEGLATPV